MLMLSMSAFRGKADIPNSRAICPLMTQSGHRLHSPLARYPFASFSISLVTR